MSSLADTFIEHYQELLEFLVYRTGSRDTAKDCAQDAWVKLSCASPCRVPDNPRSYLFRVAANMAVDWHRRTVREQHVLGTYAAQRGDDQCEPDTEQVVAARQTVRRLEAAIRQLPPRSVQVFVLHKLDGHSYAQVAALLGVSVSAVEKHMMRVLLACSAVLSD